MSQYDNTDCAAYDRQRNSEIYLPEKDAVLHAAGDLKDLSVLDLACGSGVYSRLVRKSGAVHVVGVDISTEMLEIARRYEAKEDLGIKYFQADVANMNPLGYFDRILAVWLFNYARTFGELQKMIKTAASNLSNKGLLVALTVNPDFILPESGWGGWDSSTLAEKKLSHCIEYTQKPTGVKFYKWTKPVYEKALKLEFFDTFEWRKISAPESCASSPRFQSEQWQQFIHNPPLIVLTASRSCEKAH